jgi:RNA polymerase sigma-70 factor (ECF subfamily)
MENTDDYYIREIRAGGDRQKEAIEQLYKQYFFLVKEGRKKYRQQLDDDDLVAAYNEAIIKVREKLAEGVFRGESTISTYLHRIFFNKCVDALRQKNGHPTEPIERAPEEEDGENDALKKLIQKEQITRVFGCLNEIGDPCKQILLDSEYWGYSADEIAKRIGFSNAASVNSKKYTCLQRLREMLGGKN